MKFTSSIFLTLILLVVGQSAFAQQIKDVNVVNIPDMNVVSIPAVTVSNIPATQTVDGTIDIGNFPGRRLVVFLRECTVPIGSTNCTVTDVPPAPSGSIYVFSRIWNGSNVYSIPADIFFFMSAPDEGSSTTNFTVVRSMTPLIHFGTQSSSFKLDTEFNIQATAVNSIVPSFKEPAQFETLVPFFFQAEIVPLQ